MNYQSRSQECANGHRPWSGTSKHTSHTSKSFAGVHSGAQQAENKCRLDFVGVSIRAAGIRVVVVSSRLCWPAIDRHARCVALHMKFEYMYMSLLCCFTVNP